MTESMNTMVQFELIKYWSEHSGEYQYYWINNQGIISSPYFMSSIDANKYLKDVLNFFDKQKKGQEAK